MAAYSTAIITMYRETIKVH